MSHVRYVSPIKFAPLRPAPPMPAMRSGPGRGWRGEAGKLPNPQHAHPLVRHLYAEMRRQDVTRAELAKMVGCSVSAVAGWASEKNPQLVLIEAALNALGWKLIPVREESQ